MSDKWKIHSKKRRAVLAWILKDAGIVREEGPIWADGVNYRMFVILLSPWQYQKILERSQRKLLSNRNKLSIIKLTCNVFLFLGCGSQAI